MSNWRQRFPYLQHNKDEIYFDSAATNLKLDTVIAAEGQYLSRINANPHTTDFDNAYIATESIVALREKIALFLHTTNPKEIVLTSGTTYALNQIAFGLAHNISKKNNIVLTTLEHASNLLPWQVVAKKTGAELRFAPLLNDGTIDIAALAHVVDENTYIVSFASISNTIGAINDVAQITKQIKTLNQNTIVCVDGAQSIAHIATDVVSWGIDLFCFSAHKLFGPFGLGVLWGKMVILEQMEPLMYGGGGNLHVTRTDFTLTSIPLRFEPGTPNMSAIYGFLPVFEFLTHDASMPQIMAWEQELKQYATSTITNKIKNPNLTFYNLNNDDPMILFNLKGAPAQDIGTFLWKKYHIGVRTGSLCAKLMGELIECTEAVRVSFSIFNTKSEIDVLIEALEHIDEWMETLI